MSINWLPLSHRKGIILPKVEFEEPNGQVYGGYCDYSKRRIVVVNNNDTHHEANILSHEFRHWQQLVLNLVKIVVLSPEIGNHTSYESMIKWYFTNSASEFDALLYSHKYAKSDISEYWLRQLVNYKEPK